MTGPAELPRHEGPSPGSMGRSVPPSHTRRQTCPARQALCRPLLGPLWSPSLTDREGTGRSIPTLPVLGDVRVTHGSDLQVPPTPRAAPWSRDLPPPAPPVTAPAPSRRKAEGPGRQDGNGTSRVPVTTTERSFGPCRGSDPRAGAYTPRKVHHVICARHPTRRHVAGPSIVPVRRGPFGTLLLHPFREDPPDHGGPGRRVIFGAP